MKELFNQLVIKDNVLIHSEKRDRDLGDRFSHKLILYLTSNTTSQNRKKILLITYKSNFENFTSNLEINNNLKENLKVIRLESYLNESNKPNKLSTLDEIALIDYIIENGIDIIFYSHRKCSLNNIIPLEFFFTIHNLTNVGITINPKGQVIVMGENDIDLYSLGKQNKRFGVTYINAKRELLFKSYNINKLSTPKN